LKAGTHALKVQFAEGAGGYNLSVRFAGPNVAKQDIPDSQFVVDATPVITSVAPGNGPPAGGTAITINGQNFTNIGAFGDNPVLPPVSVNGGAATNVTVVSPTKITATTPSSTTGGPVAVSVQTISGPSGTLAAGAANGFAYDVVTITWKGTVSSNWSDAGNWDLNRAPANGDAVVLTGQGSAFTTMDIANLTLYSLTFNGTTTTPRTVTISAPATALSFQGTGGGIFVNTAAADHTLAGALVLNDTLNVTVGANRNFTLSGVISGAALNALNLNGPGKLTLGNANNSYTGTTVVGNGTLAVGTINNGGALSSIGASTKASANLVLNANAILQFTGGSGTSDRGLTLGIGSASIDVGSGSSLQFSGLVTGAGTLTKTGVGQLVLSNLFNNYGGDTVNAGRLNGAGSGAFGIGPIALNNGATLGLGSVPSVVSGFGGSGAGWSLNGGATVAGDVLTLTTNALNQTRSAFYTTTQSYAGGFTVSFVYQCSPAGAATQKADGTTFCLQTVGVTALGGGGGGLAYSGISPSVALELNIYPPQVPGVFLGSNGATGGAAGNKPTTPIDLTAGNPVRVTATYSPPPVGTVKIDMQDLAIPANTFSLTVPNVDLQALLTAQQVFIGFTGATGGVSSGQTVSNFTYTPNASAPYPNVVTVNGNAIIDVNPSAQVPALALSGLVMSNNAGLTLNANVAAPLGQAYGLATVATTLGVAPKFTVNNNGAGIGTLTLGGIDDGGTARTVTKVGPGTLGAGGAFVNVSNGTLFSISSGAMSIAGQLAMGFQSTVDLAAGTSLNLNTTISTLGLLTGTGTVNLNGGALTIGSTLNNLSGSFGGTITDGSAAGSIIKDGTGNFTLATGTTHTYTGPTIVSAGALTVNGTLSNTAVSAGSQGVLRGTGTINTTVTADGQIFPGTAGALGTLTVKGVVLNATGVLRTRATGTSTAVTTDQLTVTGSTVTLTSGATLQLGMNVKNGNYTPALNNTLLNATAGNPLANTFTNVIVTNQAGNPPNAGVKVNYVDSGNTVQATQTIPSTATLNGGGQAITPVNRVILNLSGNVTPVTVETFSARVEGSGTLIEWTLSSELNNVGFNIYRRSAGDVAGAWIKTNAAMLAGRLTDAGAKSYRFYDWAPLGVHEYRLESIDTAGMGEFYSKLAGPVALGNGDSAVSLEGIDAALNTVALEHSAARAAQLTHDSLMSRETQTSRDREEATHDDAKNRDRKGAAEAAHERHVLAAWLNAASVREIAAATPREAGAAQNPEPGTQNPGTQPLSLPRSILRPARSATSNAAKIVSDKSGVLLISQSMLPAGFNANRVRIQREGRALSALAVSSEGLLLYAPGYSDNYTDKDAFFLSTTLSATSAGARTQAQGLFAPGVSVQTTTGATSATQFRDVYFDWDLRPYDYPPYFSSQYLTQSSAQSFTLNIDNAATGAASLMVNVWSLTADAHALQAFVNGTAVGAASWNGGGKFMAAQFELPAGVLTNGANQIELVTPEIGGTATQIALLHSLSINYTRNLVGRISNPPTEIVNSGTAARMFEVAGLSTSALWVVDARYADRAALVPYETQAQADGSYKARFTAQAGGTGKYLVVPAGSELKPVSVSKRVLKPAPAVAYLATGPNQFANAVQSLIATRTKEGIKGAFVDQEQLFDYYNYGRFGPEGIRNAVRAMRPQYLLLAGRTSTDYLNTTGNVNVDPLCPSYLISTTFWSQTVSDAAFGDLGRGYPEVRVSVCANSGALVSIDYRASVIVSHSGWAR
jgi:autotransporter-associated beta strand protein